MKSKLTKIKFGYLDDEDGGDRVFEIKWGNGAGWWEGRTMLALIIAELCKKFRDDKNGVPMLLKWREHMSKEEESAFYEENKIKYNNDLNKIIVAMELINDSSKSDYDKVVRAKIDEGLELLGEYFETFWD